MNITINKPELFAAAARFVSTETTRYYLQGVLIEPGGYIVATDGHRMFAGHDAGMTGCDVPVIIRPPKIKMPAKWFNSTGVIELNGTTAVLGDDTQVAQTINGTFPDWRQIISKKFSYKWPYNLTYKGQYIADFGDVGRHLGVTHPRIAPNGTNPALITFGDRDDCFGLLMPFDTKIETPATVPGWAGLS